MVTDSSYSVALVPPRRPGAVECHSVTLPLAHWHRDQALPPACERLYWDASGPAASQVGSQYHSLGGQMGPSTRRPTPALGPLDPAARDPRTQLCLPVGQHQPQHPAPSTSGHTPTPGPRDLAPPHQLTGTTLGVP